MKTRLHKKQQNCSKLLTLFTMGVALLSGVVAMGISTIRESYHQVRAVSYSDVDYTITLSADELNNYTFINFNNACLSILIANNNGYIFEHSPSYNDTGYYLDEESYEDNYYKLVYYDTATEQLFLSFNYFDLLDNKFHCGISDEELEYTSFDSSLTMYFIDNDVYSSIKQAIELDIQANQIEPTQPMLDFISIIVSGIGVFASGVASGVSDFASALFLKVENGTVVGLSVFGGILAIFAGLALAVGITIKVYNWITSFGN